MGITEGRSMVVKENWPLGDLVRCDYEPCSWRVRSRFGESLSRNGFPLGIYWSKLEKRKVKVDCAGVVSEKGVECGGDYWGVLSI